MYGFKICLKLFISLLRISVTLASQIERSLVKLVHVMQECFLKYFFYYYYNLKYYLESFFDLNQKKNGEQEHEKIEMCRGWRRYGG